MTRLLCERMDELVAPGVREPAERRLQAWSIGGLIGTGLAATVLSPVLAVLGLDVSIVVAPLVVAGLLLAAAAWLANRGSVDAAAWFYGTLMLLGAGAAVFATGSVSPAWLLAMPILPIEALVVGRRHLATSLAGSMVAVVGAGALLSGVPPVSFGFGEMLAGLLALSHAGFAARRVLRRRQARSEAIRTADAGDLAAAAEFFDAAWLRVDRDGEIAMASPAACALMAMDDTVPAAAGLLARIHPADQAAVAAALIAVSRGDGRRRVELRLRRHDGTWRPSVAALAAAPGGEAIDAAINALVEDRPDARALQTALETATQSSAAKSHFLAAMSHELRTPLNAIIGFSDILDQEFFGGFESDRQKEYVGLIRQSGQHLLQVVNSLLDVSKIEAGRYELVPEAFSPSEAMAAAADMVRDEARHKGLRLDLRPCNVETIVADRRACHQILLNLLSNAVKFTDSGVVTLEARSNAESIEISVSDTGIGISDADIDSLGRPFVQVSCGTARRYQGTGLGLSLVKGLVELHGGTFAITSQPAIGTMVTIRLPRDCTSLADPSCNPKENIVALSDARTKTNHIPKLEEARRTA